MCKCCKQELNNFGESEFCENCLLEFERNDISYRKPERKTSVQFYRSLLREKF